MQPIELLTRIGRLEDDPPIGLGSVDLTINGPTALRRKFDEVFTYIAAVERAVTQNVAEIAALLPALDPLEHRFLSIWSTHELAHAAIFDALRAEARPGGPGHGATPSRAPGGGPTSPTLIPCLRPPGHQPLAP